jgi:hypothetical protein
LQSGPAGLIRTEESGLNFFDICSGYTLGTNLNILQSILKFSGRLKSPSLVDKKKFSRSL